MDNTPVVSVPVKPWYLSKIIWVAVIQAVIGIVLVISSQYPEIGGIAILKSVLDVILRVVSVSPVV